jgi:hypothetical protein
MTGPQISSEEINRMTPVRMGLSLHASDSFLTITALVMVWFHDSRASDFRRWCFA